MKEVINDETYLKDIFTNYILRNCRFPIFGTDSLTDPASFSVSVYDPVIETFQFNGNRSGILLSDTQDSVKLFINQIDIDFNATWNVNSSNLVWYDDLKKKDPHMVPNYYGSNSTIRFYLKGASLSVTSKFSVKDERFNADLQAITLSLP